jgi:hypothetical protein
VYACIPYAILVHSHYHTPIHPSTIQTVGQCKLTYALTPKGKVLAEFTVCFLGGEGEEESFYIVGSRDYTWHDQRCCVVLYCIILLYCTALYSDAVLRCCTVLMQTCILAYCTHMLYCAHTVLTLYSHYTTMIRTIPIHHTDGSKTEPVSS